MISYYSVRKKRVFIACRLDPNFEEFLVEKRIYIFRKLNSVLLARIYKTWTETTQYLFLLLHLR